MWKQLGTLALGVLLASQASADELRLVIDKAFGDKYFSEITWPYVKTIYPSKSLNASSADADIDVTHDESNTPGEFTDLFSSDIEDQLTDFLLESDENTLPNGVLKDLATALAQKSKKSTKEDIKATLPNVLNENPALADALGAEIKKWIDVDVRWVKVRVNKKPLVTISNPITLTNLDLGVKAELRACVKIGKWRCTGYFTVGYINLAARQLALNLYPVPPELLGQPKFNDLDIVIKFKLFGKTFKVKVGITSIVNKGLDPVVVADFSSFEIDVIDTKRQFKVDKIVPTASNDGLAISVALKAVDTK